MCDLIAISSLPGNCFSTFSLIILTLGLGSSHVSKQNPWKIPSFPVSSASDPNCLWNNLWMLWHRLWGPAWVNTWFGHSPAWDLGASQPLPMTPSVHNHHGFVLGHMAAFSPFLCTRSRITSMKSQLGAQPPWENVHSARKSCSIYEASALHKP